MYQVSDRAKFVKPFLCLQPVVVRGISLIERAIVAKNAQTKLPMMSVVLAKVQTKFLSTRNVFEKIQTELLKSGSVSELFQTVHSSIRVVSDKSL